MSTSGQPEGTVNSSKMNRRKFLIGATGGAIAVIAAGTGIYLYTRGSGNGNPTSSSLSPMLNAAKSKYLSGAEKEGQVVVYNTSEDSGPLQSFGTLFPKISVQNVTSGIGVVVQKIQQEALAGTKTNDIFEGIYSSAGMAVAPDSANYEPLSIPSWLNDWNSLSNPAFKFSVPNWMVTFGFVYNSSLVSADQVPTSINDLLDPKWAGKILWRTPWIGASATFHMIAWDAYFGRDFTKWTNYFQQLWKNANNPFIADYSQFNTAIGTGQYAIGMADPDSAVPGFSSSYPNLKYGVFKEGVGYDEGGFSLNKDAPHPNAGKLLIEYSISDEGQSALSDAGIVPASSVSGNVKLPSHVSDALSTASASLISGFVPRWLEILTYWDSDPVKSSNTWVQKIQEIYGATSSS